MAKAAYCAQCGTNVWVTADGRCPNGHGPEALSNFYEAPTTAGAQDQRPLSPAEAAVKEAQTSGAARSHKTLTIVLTVAAVLVLCGLAACVGTCVWAGSSAEDTATDTPELDPGVFDEAAQEQADAGPTEQDINQQFADSAAADLGRMVTYFYPAFTLEEYYLVDSEDAEGTAVFHAIAAYNGEPAFRITFFADRSSADSPAGSETAAQAYYDEQAGVWWLHPQTRDHSLDTVFGPNALMVDSMMKQIATDFVAAHPKKLVSDVNSLTNVDLGFGGIDESEIIDWYDDGESFTSTWKLDLNDSRWNEIDYAEN